VNRFNFREVSVVVSQRLDMRGIVKEFPGVKALDSADFQLEPGKVHALLGINGAGKSTLIKILSGVYQKDSGEIYLNGEKIEINSAQSAIDKGIATVYQDPNMIPSFTGYENIYLGFESEKKGLFPRINRKKLQQQAEDLLDRFSVEIDLTKPVSQLSAVEKETIAILRALSRDMSVLVLDEPTSILTEKETKILFDLIETLKAKDISIIYITHRLEEVEQIADQLTVFRGGKNVATLDVKKHGADHLKIAELMLGKKMESVYPDKTPNPQDTYLSVKNLTLNGKFKDISFEAKKGEVLGIFGLVGSGIDELCKVLFGIFPKSKGQINIHNQEVSLKYSTDAIKNGILLVPGDRRQEGQIGDEPIKFNISISNLKRISGNTGLIKSKVENVSVQELVDVLKVSPTDILIEVALLSGGNQQKVVIAKTLFAEGDVYIFEEPTVGVDVGAKAGIYKLIRELSKDKAVIVVSSDCEEIYGNCDRIIVMYKGEAVMNCIAEESKLEEILLYGVKGGEANGK
jgi:ribose transport system ATP-binding protein